ncbi:MAG: MBL fold metallo-hydrolase [Clostridia bacterium]|nr:MBL fold metallo-hydrolase [Clostridia bacterium]
MQMIRISPRGFGSNTYVLTEDGVHAIVIDPAQPRVEKELDKLGMVAEYVLLTHCHFDHVGGAEYLQVRGAKVLCLDKEKSLIGTAADLSAMFGAPPVGYHIDDVFEDNEEKMLCGFSVKALATPGHTKGSVCYLITAKDGGRYLFTGDTLFMDSIGRTDFPTGNLEELRKSLRRLADLEGDYPVYAGHQEETTLERERECNPFLRDA